MNKDMQGSSHFLIFYVLLLVFQCVHSGCASNKHYLMNKADKLPDYVIIDDTQQSASQKSVLTTKAKEVSFPLSDEDREIISILEKKFDNEKNCAGLAAPQIGFNKQIIVFSSEDITLKEWRPDLTQMMSKTIWINPSYSPLEEDKKTDFEACFSVSKVGGEVSRFKKITYSAFLSDGSKVSGTAEGFLARIIQHEVDHVQGILFVDRAEKDKLFSLEEYIAKRKAKIGK